MNVELTASAKTESISAKDLRIAIRIADIIRDNEFSSYMDKIKNERDLAAPKSYWAKCTSYDEEKEMKEEEKKIKELDITERQKVEILALKEGLKLSIKQRFQHLFKEVKES